MYLPLEFVEERDFGARAGPPVGALPADERQRLDRDLAAVAGSVRALHAAGHVHRDLSMRNIRITPDGVACLLDLEIAHRVGDPAVPFSQGTPGFVSPQQLAEEPPAFADDVYALGAVLLCALTGCDPQRRSTPIRPTGRARCAPCPAPRSTSARWRPTASRPGPVPVRTSLTSTTHCGSAHADRCRATRARPHGAGPRRPALAARRRPRDGGLWLSPTSARRSTRA